MNPLLCQLSYAAMNAHSMEPTAIDCKRLPAGRLQERKAGRSRRKRPAGSPYRLTQGPHSMMMLPPPLGLVSLPRSFLVRGSRGFLSGFFLSCSRWASVRIFASMSPESFFIAAP